MLGQPLGEIMEPYFNVVEPDNHIYQLWGGELDGSSVYFEGVGRFDVVGNFSCFAMRFEFFPTLIGRIGK